MPALATSQSATVNITSPNGYITVTCANGDVMQVDWVSPGSASGSRTVRQITEDVGPFSDGTVITLRAVSGSPQYTEVVTTSAQAAAIQTLISGAGTYVNANGALYGLAETTPYVTPTPTAGSSAFSGACELAGWFCSVAAGTITIYDALSAIGTPLVPATTLAVGPMPIFGAGTTGKLALTTGCFVVLSGAATVRVLVA